MARRAKTPYWVRWQIRFSTESIASLAIRYGLNPKTVAKWKKRTTFEDRRSGPKAGALRRLKINEEQLAVAFRAYSRLPLDDCVEILKHVFPRLTRSSYYRCLLRYNMGRLASLKTENLKLKTSIKAKTFGILFADVLRLYFEEGQLYVLICTELQSKSIFAEIMVEKDIPSIVAAFGRLIGRMPFKPSHVVVNNAGLLVPRDHFDYDADRDPLPALQAAYDISLSMAFNGLRLHRVDLAIALQDWLEQHATNCSRAGIQAYVADAVQKYNGMSRLRSLGNQCPSDYLDGLLTARIDRRRIRPSDRASTEEARASRRGTG